MGKITSKGQSTVEYMLLIGVVTVISITILKSPIFQNIIGVNSSAFDQFRNYMEFSYRHAYVGEGDPGDDFGDYTGDHGSYYNNDTGSTRFFSGTGVYGN